MHEYFENIHKALKEFHAQEEQDDADFQAKYFPPETHLKPLYMLIKVDVDADIVYNQCQAGKYAVNHCNNMYYELADWYDPDDEQYPYIAK